MNPSLPIFFQKFILKFLYTGILFFTLFIFTGSIFAEKTTSTGVTSQPQATTENTQNTGTPTPEENTTTAPQESSESPENSDSATTSNNKAIQILKDRQKKIQEGLAKSDEEKKVDENEEQLAEVQIKKENLSEINTQIQEEVNSLKAQLLQKKKQEEALRNSLKNEQQKNAETEKSLKKLEEHIKNLQNKISIKDAVLEKNAKEISALSQEEELKKAFLEQSVKLKKKLDEREAEDLSQKFTIFFGVTAFFIFLSFLRVFISKKINENKKLKKKYAAKIASFDVLSLFFYIGFLVWFFFYVKPELVVYLLFLVGAIVMVLQEYIFSMISSIFIVQRYAVGNRILFEKKEGIIDKLTLLKVNIRNIDDRGVNVSEMRIVSNSQFMKGSVTILPRHEIEHFNFRIILPNDLSINEPALIQRIEENVLQKSITVKSVNEIIEQEYFYDIDFTFTSTGHPVIEISWHETGEKSSRIKRKILAEIEEVKKEALERKGEIKKGEEENLDHVTGIAGE